MAAVRASQAERTYGCLAADCVANIHAQFPMTVSTTYQQLTDGISQEFYRLMVTRHYKLRYGYIGIMILNLSPCYRNFINNVDVHCETNLRDCLRYYLTRSYHAK